MRSLSRSLTTDNSKLAKQLTSRYAGPIANGDVAIFPVKTDGQCLIKKNLEGTGVTEEVFNQMLNAGTGLLMLISYGRKAGILPDPDSSDFFDTVAYERALHFLPSDPLCQPKAAARVVFSVKKERMRTELNS